MYLSFIFIFHDSNPISIISPINFYFISYHINLYETGISLGCTQRNIFLQNEQKEQFTSYIHNGVSGSTLHFQDGPATCRSRCVTSHTRVVAGVAYCGLAQRQDQGVLVDLVVDGAQQGLSVLQPVDVDGQVPGGDHAHDPHRLAAIHPVGIELKLVDLGQLWGDGVIRKPCNRSAHYTAGGILRVPPTRVV